MDKSMHVSRATYVSAFEHIPYSARGSAIMHVAHARVHMTPRACARCEHQYVSDIEVKKEQAASIPTLVSCQTWRVVVFIGLRTRFVQHGRRAGRVSRAMKNTLCSLLRGIYSHAFLMQPAILPRPSEARVDNPALPSAHDSPHTPGLGLAWERGSLCRSSLRRRTR